MPRRRVDFGACLTDALAIRAADYDAWLRGNVARFCEYWGRGY